MSQGTTGSGAFRFPYNMDAIIEPIREKLLQIGMDSDLENLLDTFTSLYMDRDRALEDYTTAGSGTILFATVDGNGEGDYTSIKEAVEDVASYGGTSGQAFSVIYVKPYYNTGLGYDEQGDGNVAMPSNTVIMLWAGGMEGTKVFTDSIGQGQQKWRTDGFDIPSGSGSSLALVGFDIEMAAAKALVNTNNPTAPIYIENCTVAAATVGYGLQIPTRMGGTWVMKGSAFAWGNQGGTLTSSGGALANYDIKATDCLITFGPSFGQASTILNFSSTATAIFQGSFINCILAPPSTSTQTLDIDGGGWSGTGGSNLRIIDCQYGLGDLNLLLGRMAVHINGWHQQFKRDSDSPVLNLTVTDPLEQVSPSGATAGTGFTCTNVVLPFATLTLTDTLKDTDSRTAFSPGILSGTWSKVTINANSINANLALFSTTDNDFPVLTVSGHYNNIMATARYTNWTGTALDSTACLVTGHDNRIDITAQHILNVFTDAGYNNVINGGLSGTPLTTAIVDAKGDLLAGFGPDDIRRFGVGSDGQRLTADSTETLGLEWANPTFFTFDANGDLLVGTGNNSFVRVPIGAAQRVLRADPANAAGGVSWDYQRTLNNRLTQNQASLETDTAGWTAESGCTIARSTAEASHGAASLEITKS
jgi:hypothetical protein